MGGIIGGAVIVATSEVTVPVLVVAAVGAIWTGGGAAVGSGIQGNEYKDVKQDFNEGAFTGGVTPFLAPFLPWLARIMSIPAKV